jgi:hypothetical protein
VVRSQAGGTEPGQNPPGQDKQRRAIRLASACLAPVDFVLAPYHRLGSAPPADDALLARIKLDATRLDLEPSGDHLYIAGGSFGLLEVDWRAATNGTENVQNLIRDDDRRCVDVEIVGNHLLALFAATEASELVVLDASTNTVIKRVPLSRGLGYAIASRDSLVWAAGVHVAEMNGRRRLIVGDQKAGLRIYR